MNLLFINYHTFDGNSAIHIQHLANELTDDKTATTVCVTKQAGGAQRHSSPPRFTARTHADARANRFGFPDGRGPDLIHAWTPRECVRRITEQVVARHQCPYLVHLEDNEMAILEKSTGRSPQAFQRLSPLRQWLMTLNRLSHPQRHRDFLQGAAGITVLLDRLQELAPPALPCVEFWPAFDDTILTGAPADPGHRRQLGLSDRDLVVFYPGNLNAVNRDDVCNLYRAIALANDQGVPARLVRTGLVDHVKPVKTLGLATEYFRDLGFVDRSEIGRLYRLADVLVQPGAPDVYNDYRFPSKLPEFFASARPVILPHTNIGRHATDGENSLLLSTGSPDEIASHLARLHQDPTLRDHMGRAGRTFAETHFSWPRAARILRDFYRKILPPAPDIEGANGRHVLIS